jgi:hypothetical protein
MLLKTSTVITLKQLPLYNTFVMFGSKGYLQYEKRHNTKNKYIFFEDKKGVTPQ